MTLRLILRAETLHPALRLLLYTETTVSGHHNVPNTYFFESLPLILRAETLHPAPRLFLFTDLLLCITLTTSVDPLNIIIWSHGPYLRMPAVSLCVLATEKSNYLPDRRRRRRTTSDPTPAIEPNPSTAVVPASGTPWLSV